MLSTNSQTRTVVAAVVLVAIVALGSCSGEQVDLVPSVRWRTLATDAHELVAEALGAWHGRGRWEPAESAWHFQLNTKAAHFVFDTELDVRGFLAKTDVEAGAALLSFGSGYVWSTTRPLDTCNSDGVCSPQLLGGWWRSGIDVDFLGGLLPQRALSVFYHALHYCWLTAQRDHAPLDDDDEVELLGPLTDARWRSRNDDVPVQWDKHRLHRLQHSNLYYLTKELASYVPRVVRAVNSNNKANRTGTSQRLWLTGSALVQAVSFVLRRYTADELFQPALATPQPLYLLDELFACTSDARLVNVERQGHVYRSRTDIAAGAQLLRQCPRWPNDRLLFQFGTALLPNPVPVDLSLPVFFADESDARNKLSLLRRLGLQHYAEPSVHGSLPRLHLPLSQALHNGDGPLRHVMRVMALSDDEAVALRKRGTAPSVDQPLSPLNEFRAINTTHDVVQRALYRFNLTELDDEQNWQAMAGTRHSLNKAILAYVREERALLSRAKRLLTDQLIALHRQWPLELCMGENVFHLEPKRCAAALAQQQQKQQQQQTDSVAR